MKMDRKFKINKVFFNTCVEYLSIINSLELKDIDVTDITDDDISNCIEEWNTTGLNNRDFILSIIGKYGSK